MKIILKNQKNNRISLLKYLKKKYRIQKSNRSKQISQPIQPQFSVPRYLLSKVSKKTHFNRNQNYLNFLRDQNNRFYQVIVAHLCNLSLVFHRKKRIKKSNMAIEHPQSKTDRTNTNPLLIQFYLHPVQASVLNMKSPKIFLEEA